VQTFQVLAFVSNGLQISEPRIREVRLMLRWMDTHADVPEGKWFKRFPEMLVWGEGELIKAFLVPGQAPTGEDKHLRSA